MEFKMIEIDGVRRPFSASVPLVVATQAEIDAENAAILAALAAGEEIC